MPEAPEKSRRPMSTRNVDIAEIDLGLLLALDALLGERNITRAAIRLGISQPALSARLNRLRQIFGDALFVPAVAGRGVVATPRAADLQAELVDLLGKLRHMVKGPAAFNPAETRRTFTIAIHENPATILVPDLTSRVMAAAPDARLAFVRVSADVVDRLERGEVDLWVTIVAGSDKTSGGLMLRPLFEDTYLTGQRKGHPRGIGPFDLDTFCALTHIFISTDGGVFSGALDEALATLGRVRRRTVSIQNYALAPTIVASSDCVCTLPSRFLKHFAGVLDLASPPVELELPPPRFFARWHPRNQEDPGHLWLRECLYDVAAQA
jgi:DNA-binding transcriptional LysR family regulator